jgi:fermentation-respiration switch protein FrsA (DUF1100 family)
MRRLLLLILPLLTGCTGLLFQPLEPHVLDPAKVGVEARDIYFKSADGVNLHGWFLPAKDTAAGTVLFLHGNAENVSTHIGSVYWLPDYGFNVFLFDYRGFGRSEGEPTLEGIHTDFAAALDTVFGLQAVDPRRVVVFGQSMGAATAITGLAQSPYRTRIRALVVEGAPSSYRTVAREALNEWWLTWLFQWPLSMTIDDSYRPLDQVGKISPTPLLIVHSRDDEVISFDHAQALYEAAREPKELWPVAGARHIAAFTTAGPRARLVEYLRRSVAPEP